MTSQTPDPAAQYIYILNQLRYYQLVGQIVPPAEQKAYFRTLMYICDSLIRENQRLHRQISISTDLMTDLEVDLLMRDLDILALTPNSDESDEKKD